MDKNTAHENGYIIKITGITEKYEKEKNRKLKIQMAFMGRWC